MRRPVSTSADSSGGVRVRLPAHLRELAGVEKEIRVEPPAPTLAGVLGTLEDRYPHLRGTIRDPASGERRAYMRYFACGRDLSHDAPDAPLPQEVAAGEEPLRVVGAIAGG